VHRSIPPFAGAALATVALLGACGGDDQPPMPDRAALQQACPTLAGKTVEASAIGLPSGTASVAQATLVAAAGDLPEFCQLLGSIAARTAGADAIRFQINLPTNWNEKALMVGGGGFNGTLINSTAALRDAAPGQPLPLATGYATFSTDSGHDATAYNATDPGKFALNDEMFENFAHASYKKVKDVAHVLLRSYYLRAPAKQYFYGGSEGGREGLTMAQRYPADFDGIVSAVPVIHWTGLFNGFIAFTQPQFSGGTLSTAKVRLVANAVNTTCDALDGLADGVVNNYLACPARFSLDSLRCAGGADTGDSCLSDPQLATLKAAYGPVQLPFALANGITTYPGRLFGGEIQLGGEGIGRWVSTGQVPSVPTPLATDARGVNYGSSYARYVIARDANFDVRTYSAANFTARIQAVSALMDSTNPDLSAFFQRGGKLIVRENAGDMAQSAQAGIQYYQSVVAKMGQADVDRAMRLYVSPASNHSGTAASLTTGVEVATNHDMLNTLDQWVSTGQAPADALVQVRKATTAPYATLATRPLCRYPNYPQYVAGDTLSAGSYRCAVSAP
jgi:feruloyl esterase